MVIEITSKSTKREDKTTKKELYRDVLKVAEYFQFDPTEDYLKPPLQGFRLVEGEYLPIQPDERPHYPVRYWDCTWSETGRNSACSIP